MTPQQIRAADPVSGRTAVLMRGAVGFACILIIVLPQLRYAALHSAYYDLGQYVTNYTLFALDGHWDIAFRSHAHPIMAVVAPLFWLWPGPQLLLIVQSLLLVIGIFLYGRLWGRLGAGSAVMGAALCCSCVAIWSVALFDYHFEPFLFVLVFGFFLRLEHDGPNVELELLVIAVAIAFVKENYALTSLGLGLYLVATGRHRSVGLLIAMCSTIYFYLATTVFIPAFSDGRQAGDLWHDAFAYLGRTPVDIALNIVTEPWRLTQSGLFAPRKLLFLAATALPFLPGLARAPLVALPAVPHVVTMMLSRDSHHSYIPSQYSVPVVVPFLVAAAYAFGRQSLNADSLPPSVWRQLYFGRPGIVFTAAGSLTILMLFGVSPVSRLFWTPAAWSFNAAAYIPTERDARIKNLLNDHVPTDRRLVVSMPNTLHDRRLSTRSHAFAFPEAVFEPAKVLPAAASRTHAGAEDARRSALAAAGSVIADFVVFDRKRPAYIGAQPVISTSGASTSDAALTARLESEYARVVEWDGFEIWRRK